MITTSLPLTSRPNADSVGICADIRLLRAMWTLFGRPRCCVLSGFDEMARVSPLRVTPEIGPVELILSLL